MRLLPWKNNLFLLGRRPGHFVRIYRWPLLVLLVGATLDLLTTIAFLSHYGVASELHPFQRWFASSLGIVPGILVAKSLQTAWAVVAAALWRPWTVWLLYACGLLYTLAAASNHFELLVG